MPLLDIVISNRIEHTVALEESIATSVNRYAAFAKVPPDDVVNKALEYVFARDKEFQQYIVEQKDAPLLGTLRVSIAASDTGFQAKKTRSNGR